MSGESVEDRFRRLSDTFDEVVADLPNPSPPLVEMIDTIREELSTVGHQIMYEKAFTPVELRQAAMANPGDSEAVAPVRVIGPDGHHEIPHLKFHIVGADWDEDGALTLRLDNMGCVDAVDHRAHDQRSTCGHGVISPYVPEGYDGAMHGAYQCDDCQEILVEVQCHVCNTELLPAQVAEHYAERCWTT